VWHSGWLEELRGDDAVARCAAGAGSGAEAPTGAWAPEGAQAEAAAAPKPRSLLEAYGVSAGRLAPFREL
jgi:hypothetical protein